MYLSTFEKGEKVSESGEESYFLIIIDLSSIVYIRYIRGYFLSVWMDRMFIDNYSFARLLVRSSQRDVRYPPSDYLVEATSVVRT